MSALPVENVQDYPRPPALEPVESEIVVRLAGRDIIRTRAAWRVCETHHAPTYYFSPDTIEADLVPVPGTSLCEWKGRAIYFDIRASGVAARRAGWSYPRPTKRFSAIAGYVALYAPAMEAITVAGLPVTPQPGGFYGGWVTPNLAGTIKGAPGTEGW